MPMFHSVSRCYVSTSLQFSGFVSVSDWCQPGPCHVSTPNVTGSTQCILSRVVSYDPRSK